MKTFIKTPEYSVKVHRASMRGWNGFAAHAGINVRGVYVEGTLIKMLKGWDALATINGHLYRTKGRTQMEAATKLAEVAAEVLAKTVNA